jgi:ABC-2 type transport system ATP-binding protein
MPEIVLHTEGLTKRYGNLTAVDDLTLDVREGEVFGFLGPNGAGKTTAINMMCGLLEPDAGRVLVHGALMHNGDRDIRSRVGVCPQDIVVWERMTCLEQLQFIGQMYGLSGQTARQRGDQLLRDLDLEEKRHRQARTLSGGMQRRLNLAMALVHDPEIVVLDEPEAGLDPQSRLKVRSYIQSLARRRTVILTTHNMDEAERLADRVAIIDHGRLLVLDTPDALKENVGAGAVIETGLEAAPDEPVLEQVRVALSALTDQVAFDASRKTLAIRAPNAVTVLPIILDTLQRAGLSVGETRLRQNTLEDVFIQLTGRGLRE